MTSPVLAPFLHAEPFEPARRLGGNCRFALCHDVSAGGKEREGLGGIYTGNHGGLHLDGTVREEQEGDGDCRDGADGDQPPPGQLLLALEIRAGFIEPQLRQVVVRHGGPSGNGSKYDNQF
jgi:hypothetical protein